MQSPFLCLHLPPLDDFAYFVAECAIVLQYVWIGEIHPQMTMHIIVDYSCRMMHNKPWVILMWKRNAKVNISSAGGTASAGSKTYKVTLPNAWMATLGIDEESRELELTFDGVQITLSRFLSGEEFAKWSLNRKHDVRLLRFFDGNRLCTTIYADFADEKVTAENHIRDPVKTAFGNNFPPTWEDFQFFLQERCIPRQRSGLREYLEAIGVGEYDPVEIIGKTAGRMAEDNQWLEMEKLLK